MNRAGVWALSDKIEEAVAEGKWVNCKEFDRTPGICSQAICDLNELAFETRCKHVYYFKIKRHRAFFVARHFPSTALAIRYRLANAIEAREHFAAQTMRYNK